MKFYTFLLLLVSSNVMSMKLSQLLNQQRNRQTSPQLVNRALHDLEDLENILLDSNIDGDEEDDNYDDFDEVDNEIKDYDPFENTRKNYRRRNYFLGHMARMNFRRNRGIHGVGNDNRYSKYRGDIRPGRRDAYLDHM